MRDECYQENLLGSQPITFICSSFWQRNDINIIHQLAPKRFRMSWKVLKNKKLMQRRLCYRSRSLHVQLVQRHSRGASTGSGLEIPPSKYEDPGCRPHTPCLPGRRRTLRTAHACRWDGMGCAQIFHTYMYKIDASSCYLKC